MPAVRISGEAARRSDCLAHLRDLAIAIQNYTYVNGHLPPAYTVDAVGNRLHSWRTLLLPYMEEKALYDKIDLTKPWDDPANAEAREQSIPPLMCASAPFEGEHLTSTTYLAVVGPDCAFTGSVPRTMSEVTDRTGITLMVVDAPYSRAVHWMSPHDLSVEEVLAFGPESKMNHNGVIQAAFLDGHAKPVALDIDRELLRGLLTIAGGKEVGEPEGF
jgi:prepilin-type processing-associated H-X9-DG protein